MTEYELMKLARKGIELEIQKQCAFIADTWASQDSVTKLENLIVQYREVMDLHTKAHDAQLKAEWEAEQEGENAAK